MPQTERVTTPPLEIALATSLVRPTEVTYFTPRWEKYGRARIEYYCFSQNPKIAIVASFHGNESDTSDILFKRFKEYRDNPKLSRLLDHVLFIPYASPSAVRYHTRTNILGQDLNRMFAQRSNDESMAIKKIFEKFPSIKSGYFFHEDMDRAKSFYMYHHGKRSAKVDRRLDRVLQNIKVAANINLLTGYDDPTDPACKYWFNNGLNYTPWRVEDGTLEFYLLHYTRIGKIFLPEIPGLAPYNVKEKIVDLLLENLIFK